MAWRESVEINSNLTKPVWSCLNLSTRVLSVWRNFFNQSDLIWPDLGLTRVESWVEQKLKRKKKIQENFQKLNKKKGRKFQKKFRKLFYPLKSVREIKVVQSQIVFLGLSLAWFLNVKLWLFLKNVFTNDKWKFRSRRQGPMMVVKSYLEYIEMVTKFCKLWLFLGIPFEDVDPRNLIVKSQHFLANCLW